jgi:hypothetical protein
MVVMPLPSNILTRSDAEEYVAFSVSGLIARLRGSPDLRVSEAALKLEKRISMVLRLSAAVKKGGRKS